MPISSGALDWPVSYYTKPLPADTLSAVDIDPWARDLAYRNWSWKDAAKKRRKGKKTDKKSLTEVRLHRRRCCCCVLWWLTTLLLVLLTLTLYLVFWTRNRTNNLPPLNPDEMDNLPTCYGEWRKTFVMRQTPVINGTSTYICCYCPKQQVLADLIQKGNVWPNGYVTYSNSTCTSTVPNCRPTSSTTTPAPSAATLVVFQVLAVYSWGECNKYF